MAEQGDTQQERTESATPKRREDSRKKGQVAKSMEVNSSAIILLSILFFYFGGAGMFESLRFYSRVIFENYDTVHLNPDNLPGYTQLVLLAFVKIMAPFTGLLMIVGLAINFLQVGFKISGEAIEPKFSKINPLKGFKRVLFSSRSLVELIKGISKIAIISSITYFAIKGELDNYVNLVDLSVGEILIYTAKETAELGLKIGLVMVILSLLDYLFQRHDFEKSIRMTKQEVKEEYKQMEGDPMIKSKIRAIQREMSRRRMMEDVPEADVVITNPTHIAIALKYKPETMEAPVIVAKGREKIAHRIKEIAIEHDIAVVEDKPLAWALYKAVDVGDNIPEDLFQAVAEVLAYVYKLKNKEVN